MFECECSHLSEPQFANLISSALNSYFNYMKGVSLPSSYAPNLRNQSYSKQYDSHCFDLLQWVSETSLIILELKVTADCKKLKFFDRQQRVVYEAMRDVGLPVSYCYNIKCDYSKVNKPLYTLSFSNTADPQYIADDNGKLANLDKHIPLISLVEQAAINGGAFGALFAGGLVDYIESTDTKLLLFAQSVEENMLIDIKLLRNIYNDYVSEVYVSAPQAIDYKKSSKSDIVEHLESALATAKRVIRQHTNNPHHPRP